MEVIKRNVGGVEVEIRILSDGVDLVLPHIHPEWPIAILDLYYMVQRDPKEGAVEIENIEATPKRKGVVGLHLFDDPEWDPAAFAYWDKGGLQVVPGDGGVLYDDAIQSEVNLRKNQWRGK